jgi:hypothetical protein
LHRQCLQESIKFHARLHSLQIVLHQHETQEDLLQKAMSGMHFREHMLCLKTGDVATESDRPIWHPQDVAVKIRFFAIAHKIRWREHSMQ